MMTGIPLIIMFVVAVVAMIVAISKFKIHPFLSIMAVSLFFAFVAGVPLKEIPGTIGSGFSGTFTSIGIVIILGADGHPARKDGRGAQDGGRRRQARRQEEPRPRDPHHGLDSFDPRLL